MSRVLQAILSIEAPPKDWWDLALNIISTEALAYHPEVPPPPPQEEVFCAAVQQSKTLNCVVMTMRL